MNRFFEGFSQSLANLSGNKTRSFLTMLGIIVGVFAIIGIISIGEAGKLSIKRDLESFGSNLAAIWAEKKSDTIYKPLNKYDVEFLKNLSYIEELSPILSLYRDVRIENYKLQTAIIGVNENYFSLNNRKIDKGRFFTSFENQHFRRVCVITEGIKKDLFDRNSIEDPVGKVIKIGDFPFFIIGVIKKVELKSILAGLVREERDVYIPENTMKTTFGVNRINYILFSLKKGIKPNIVKKTITSLFKIRKGENTYYGTQFIESQIKQFTSLMTTITLIIALIGGLSLLVGGIGIMNIMLISVTERTKEIGIKKAIGATEGMILKEFLQEAIILSLIGAFIGTIIGISITVLLELAIKWQIYISPLAIVIAIVFSTFIGALFGSIPAKKASALHPIDALRYE